MTLEMLYYVAGIVLAVIPVCGVIFKLLLSRLKNKWTEDIDNKVKDLENELEREIHEIKEDYEANCNTEKCSTRVSNLVEQKMANTQKDFELLQQALSKDISVINDNIKDLKVILSNQQETLLAMNMTLAELKPRIKSLEDRVNHLENRPR